MAKCDTCGNEYDHPLEVTYRGGHYLFDSFECAIQKLAPECAHCGVRIIGHGVGAGGHVYCCEQCASQTAAAGPGDRRSIARRHGG